MSKYTIVYLQLYEYLKIHTIRFVFIQGYTYNIKKWIRTIV